MPLEVEVVSADRRVWRGSASAVLARTVDGDTGILAGHAPVLAVLAEGVLRITPVTGDPVLADLDGGFLSVDNDRVTVVARRATVTSGTSAN